MEIYTDINLQLNEIQDAALHTVSAEPPGVIGQIVFDTTINKPKVYDGTNWLIIPGSPTGGLSGSVAYFSALNSPQNDLNSGGIRKVQLHSEHLNTITGASMTDSVITLPAGVYFFTMSFVATPSGNNIELGCGAKINGAVEPIRSAFYFKWKNKDGTIYLSNTISQSSQFTLEFYGKREYQSGTLVTENNSGGVSILQLGEA
jgi:hypothetical protein